jgi:putative cardiolipin synthase
MLSACSSLPPAERIESHVLTQTGQTRLGGVARDIGQRAGLAPADDPRSAVRLVTTGRDAFLARATLGMLAERSIDAQYYIWHNDETGQLLLASLLQAADRGVRIRLLLDDIHTADLDPMLAALDAHPRVEVRLYNPFAHRDARWLDYLTDLRRVNRRMHNKSFIADSQLAVVGGRNVGNEYFSAQASVDFGDLDAIVTGPIVGEVDKQFDLYWNSPSAYPIASLVPGVQAGALALLRERAASIDSTAQVKGYLADLRHSTMARDMLDGRLDFQAAKASLVYDDPSKTLARKGDSVTRLTDRLAPLVADTREEMVLVSPYFVPMASGTESIARLQAGGVRTTILTNSLASNDVGAVHAGYARYRSELLAAGVALWEVKPQPDDVSNRKFWGGSSHVSLHAKTFVFDRRKLFVGSFNLDPRSNHLNTELGILFESPALAAPAAQDVLAGLPRVAWRVERDPASNDLVWIDEARGGERLSTEPQTSFLRRLGVNLLRLLPIDSLL